MNAEIANHRRHTENHQTKIEWASHLCRWSKNLWAKIAAKWTPKDIEFQHIGQRQPWRDEFD